MKKSTYIIITTLSILISACKKTEPTIPLKIVKEETYTPPGYNPNLFYTKTYIAQFDYTVNDIVVDKTDPTKAFIIGPFNYHNNVYGKGIVKFTTTNNTISTYPNPFNSTADVMAFHQGSDGRHYVGGYIYDQYSATYRYFGSKLPNANTFTYSTQFYGEVSHISEVGSEIFLAGYFNQLNSTYCSPLLKVSNGIISEFGTPLINNMNYGVKCAANYNSTWFLSQESSYHGYLISSVGGNWTSNAGGGFNAKVNDLLVDNNRFFCAGNMTYDAALTNRMNFVNELINNVWVKLGSNNLPNYVNDLEYYNNVLYACGYNFVYYLDASDNKWKTKFSSNVTCGNLTKIKFINGKLYAIESNQNIIRLD